MPGATYSVRGVTHPLRMPAGISHLSKGLPGFAGRLPGPSGKQISQALRRNPQTWIAAGLLTIGSFLVGVLFHNNSHIEAPQLQSAHSSLIVKVQQELQFTNRWAFTEVAVNGSEEGVDPTVRRPVRTVRFDQFSGEGELQGAPVPAARVRATIHSIEVPIEVSGNGTPDEVQDYLWAVYQRQTVKKDGSGDFTWKDPAAAKRIGLSLREYVIGGMDPDFREQLYHAGRAMDAAGLQWSMLSAFRDDYRQSLASGFKARVGNSLHGGSRRTGGYGHGRAIDITLAENPDSAETVWHWIDAHGSHYGLSRPMPGYDPAHIQSNKGDWHKVAANLRQVRIRTAQANAAATPAPKVVTAAAQ